MSGLRLDNPTDPANALLDLIAVSVSENGNDTLRGGGGNDLLDGDGGDDHIFGDSGEDLILSGAGADFMDGGANIDAFFVLNINENDTDSGPRNFVEALFNLDWMDHRGAYFTLYRQIVTIPHDIGAPWFGGIWDFDSTFIPAFYL
jgi:hypothetical protein